MSQVKTRKRIPKELYLHFSVDPYPSASTILELAKLHGLTKKQTLRFFQNKRAREFPKKPSKSKVTAPPPAKADEKEPSKSEVTAPTPVEVDPFKEFWERMSVELQ